MTTYNDDFNRANTLSGLGTIPSGPTWNLLSGSWKITNNKAVSTTSPSSNPIANISISTPNASVEADLGPGDAVYGRIVDSNNWWRIRYRSWTTTSTNYQTEYEWEATYGGGGTAVGLYSWSHDHGTSIKSTSWSTNNISCPHSSSTSHSHNIPQSSTRTDWWGATNADSYREDGWWRNEKVVYQGRLTDPALWRGLWFFDWSSIQSVLKNKTITATRIQITRLSESHGSHDEQIPTLRLHQYGGPPTGAPVMGAGNSSHGVGFALGDTKWVNLATSWGNSLRDGDSRGLGLYSTSSFPYLRFSRFARLEIDSYYPSSSGGSHTHSRSNCVLTGNTRQVASGTTTTTHYGLYLERNENGTITTLANSTGQITRARLEFNGNQVKAYKGSNTSPWWSGTSSVFSDATDFGIGRGTSERDIQSLDNFRLVIFNQPPFAPSLTNPISGKIVNGNTSQRLEWNFNDPDPGDSQSYFTLEYGKVGEATSLVNSESTNTYWEASSSVLTAGDYRWRVKTKDSIGLEGVFSDWQYFTVDVPPDQPTITSPTNNGTISGAVEYVSWSAAEQDKWQLRMYSDNSGVPGTLLLDTGEINNSSTRSLQVSFPDNNVVRHIQVRVERNTLWSDWASVQVNVSYTPPQEAGVFLQALDSQGGVRIVVTNPAPEVGEPSVVENIIERRTDFTNWVAVDTIGPNDVYSDYSVQSKTVYDYRALSVGDNGTTTASAAYSITPNYSKWFLKDPDTITDINDHLELDVDGEGDMVIEQHEDQAEFQPLGREDPVIVRDVFRSDKFSITLQSMGKEQREKIIEMRRRQKTLLLQSPFEQWYITFGRDGARNIKNVISDYEHYTLQCIEQRDPFNV